MDRKSPADAYIVVRFDSAVEANDRLHELTTGALELAEIAGGTLVGHEVILAPMAESPSELNTEFMRGLSTEIDISDEYFQSGLDEPLEDVLPKPDDKIGKTRRSATINGLEKWGGLRTVRDVILLGRQGIENVRNLSGTSVTYLEHELQAFMPEVPFVDQMTPNDMAHLCTSLDQVPLSAVGPAFGLLLGIHRVTVGDVIRGRMNATEISSDRWLPQITAFAQEFEAARSRITSMRAGDQA